MVPRPRERPGVRRRGLDPLELARSRPVERQSARMLGELRAGAGWIPRRADGRGSRAPVGLPDLVCSAAAAAARPSLREGIAPLLRRLVLPVHERDRCLGQRLDRDAASTAASQRRPTPGHQDREPQPVRTPDTPVPVPAHHSSAPPLTAAPRVGVRRRAAAAFARRLEEPHVLHPFAQQRHDDLRRLRKRKQRMGREGEIVLRQVTALAEMRVVHRAHRLLARLGLFERPQVLELRHVVGVSGVAGKGDRIFHVDLRHDVRDPHRAHEALLGIAQHEPTALLRSDIEGVPTDLEQHLARNRTAPALRIEIDASNDQFHLTRTRRRVPGHGGPGRARV